MTGAEIVVLLSFIALLALVFRPRPRDKCVRRVTSTRNSRERGFGDTQY